MSETPFYRTRMGQRFFEGTVPALVDQIEKLNRTLARNAPDEQAVNDLLLATRELVNAARHVLDTEIVPGSDATRVSFASLRECIATAATAADTLAEVSKCRS